MKQIILLSFLIALSILSMNSVNAQWIQTSLPGSRGGAVYSICFKDSLLFAGIKGGVYISSDNGEHWTKANPPLPPREYGALATSMVANNEKVIAAFNEPGVYLTSDDGESWIQANIPEGIRATPQILASNRNWIIGSNIVGNSYQSFDNGLNWYRIMDFSYLNSVNSAAIQDSFALAMASGGIFLSTNYGTNWIEVKENISDYSLRSVPVFSGSKALAGIGSYSFSYILRSTDKGLTWSSDSSVLNCTSINSLIFSPDEATSNYVFAGTDSGVFRSTDNGINWVVMNNGLTSNLILSLAFKVVGTNGNPVLFAGTGNGIFKSTDYGESWSVVGSPSNWIFTSTNSEVFTVSSNSSYKGVSWTSHSSDNVFYTKVYHSNDNGLNWSEKFSGFLEKNSGVNSLASNSNNNEVNLLACAEFYPNEYSTGHGIIFSSDNNGTIWKNLNLDTTVRILSFAANQSVILLNVYSGSAAYIIHSIDNGNIWINGDTVYVSTFTFDGNKIYAGGGNNRILFVPPRNIETRHINSIIVSSDNGSSWTNVASPLDSGTIFKNSKVDTISTLSSLLVKGSHLLAGMRAYNFYQVPYSTPFAYGGGLYHLLQEGDNWIIADSSFIGKSIFAFESNGSTIFAATDTGVYSSNDFGFTWNDISSGMKNIYVSSIFKSDNYLFANTINGLWKRPLSEITSVENKQLIAEVPKDYNLSQNFPNPFNPVTQIKYSIPEDSYISLKVYNLVGEEVATLFEGNQKVGYYTTSFNGSELASGIYFYRLKANNFVETKKLIILK